MDSIKETAIETIKKLPDGCSLKDIMYELNFVAQALDGLKDSEKGNTISTEELLTRIEKWQG